MTKPRDANDVLREQGPDGVRAMHDQAKPFKAKPNGHDPGKARAVFVSQRDFLAGFVPPDYLVDGVLQRRFIYSLTGRTGGGKTAIALALTRAVACTDVNAMFGGHTVEKGHVVYFVGENPDDVRARLIGTNAKRDDDPMLDRISFVVGVFNIDEMYARLAAEAERVGGVDLVIIDTSAAYFLKDDENNNTQIGAHARSLRRLTELPGRPCVLALCHPVKYATDPAQLLPRGGGAFVAEMDGNLTAWKHDDDLVDLHHTDKLRGPGFEPITFKIEKFTTPQLVDAKGRAIPTFRVVAISEAEQAEQARNVRRDEDTLLVELLKNPDRSWADLARACGFLLDNGEPYKSKVRRIADELQASKLLKKARGQRWTLTDEGRKAAEKLNNKARADVADTKADKIAERGGATYTNKPFEPRKGRKMDDAIRCVHCLKRGGVYRIADGRLPKGTRGDALHERCAKDWFTGAPQPPDDDPSEPDIFDAKPDQDFEGDNAGPSEGDKG